MNLDQVVQEISEGNWYHSYEIFPGVLTPGKHYTNAARIFDERYSLPKDLHSARALDIGALDGPYSFELEKRGAEVIAVDIQNPDHTCFNLAKKILNSKVLYYQGNVYTLTKLFTEPFDIVCFFGVYYHLKNPIIALDQINSILADSGKLLIEGECLLNYAEPAGNLIDISLEFVRSLAESELPISLFYAGKYKQDLWTWSIPNLACIRSWLDASAMKLVSHGFWDEYPNQRMFGTAVKDIGKEVLVDNPIW